MSPAMLALMLQYGLQYGVPAGIAVGKFIAKALSGTPVTEADIDAAFAPSLTAWNAGQNAGVLVPDKPAIVTPAPPSA